MDRSEADFIVDIIDEIKTLIPKWVHVGENIVGKDEKLKEVKLLIDAQSNKVWLGFMGLVGLVKLPLPRLFTMIC